jgi:solute carrier family 30 (zinc transporter), member 2
MYARKREAPNINVRAAYIHVLSDMIMSIGVVIAAAFIFVWPQLWFLDPVCTYVFSVIVFFTTVPLAKSCLHVMMEGAPESIDLARLESDIFALNQASPGLILNVHDMHVWSISTDILAMTAHITSHEPHKTLSLVTQVCREKYQLYHTVIQVEAPATQS